MNLVVYTANLRGYDELLPPKGVNPNVAYICFTDGNWSLLPFPWQGGYITSKWSRYYFDNSTLLFPNYDVTLMHGANAQLLVDPQVVVDACLGDSDIAMFKHPHRKTVWDEVKVCVDMGKEKADVAGRQYDRYRAAGFPDNIGLSCCGMIIRRNTPAVREFERLWWAEVEQGSHRDQLSFDYVRWKTGINANYIPGDIFNNTIIHVRPHG